MTNLTTFSCAVESGAKIRKVRQFQPSTDIIATGNHSKDCSRIFSASMCLFCGVTSADDKANAILVFVSAVVERRRSVPDSDGDDAYTRVRATFEKYFVPRKNERHSRFLFHRLKQKTDQSIVHFC